ncbi:MAG TPA: flagellar basal-body MS-ring/collar protein FliF [Candidatus Acidoferrales bacterium]|nr:flagellar basal-body MS-ring/collar protein FliF [Candidatus Acidoferrales bacterium]
MPEQLVNFLNDLKEMLARLLSFLSPQQKRLIFIGLPLFGSLAYAGFMVFDRLNYAPLYSNLSPQDGAAIIKELDEEKIPYSISGAGSVIEVPRGVIYQTRLRLAGKGVPAGGGVGFEIFEKTPFGASEFTQQVNYLRALQGELSRTINALSAVQSSRVHLALPARSSFLGPEEKPSASVVVDVRPGYHLSPDQVQGIVNLVASSVPKLSADKVTVIDSSGRPLKEIIPAAATTEAERLDLLKLQHEQELEHRIETMLDPVLGPGKVVVRANVQINAQETQMTKEQFDPNNKVVRSQRQSMDDSGGKTGGTPGVQANIPGGEATKVTQETASKRSSEIVTYEVGHTTSRISEPRGQIQKLSVAVLVDGKYEKDKYVPRTKEEMEVIKGMVKRAVGFDDDRGDEIEVANVAFKIQPSPAVQVPGAPDLKDMVTSPLGMGVGAGVLLALGALGFFFMRRKPATKEMISSPPAESVAVIAKPEEVQDEAAVAAQKIVLSDDPRKEQLAQIARDYHDATVRIIRTWLQEDINRARVVNNGGATGAEMPQ